MSTLDDLRKIAEKIYSDLEKGKVPSITLASRTKSNIVFDDRYRVWKYGEQKTTRSAVSLPGAYMLLRTIYVMDFIRKMIEEGKTSTLRELYYISEGWSRQIFGNMRCLYGSIGNAGIDAVAPRVAICEDNNG